MSSKHQPHLSYRLSSRTQVIRLLAEGAPVIAALWGLLVWKEYRGDMRLKSLVTLMVFLLACGLALVALSPAYLPPA